jgi:hypothetical protein
MERAGFLLLDRRLRTIDIALDVAYETPSAFCKGLKPMPGSLPGGFAISDKFFRCACVTGGTNYTRSQPE